MRRRRIEESLPISYLSEWWQEQNLGERQAGARWEASSVVIWVPWDAFLAFLRDVSRRKKDKLLAMDREGAYMDGFYPDRTTWYSLRRKGWEESWDPQADDRGMPHLGMQRGTGKETEKEQLVSEENLAFVGFRHWEESGSRGKKNSTL